MYEAHGPIYQSLQILALPQSNPGTVCRGPPFSPIISGLSEMRGSAVRLRIPSLTRHHTKLRVADGSANALDFAAPPQPDFPNIYDVGDRVMTVVMVMTVGYYRLPSWAYCENGLEHQNTASFNKCYSSVHVSP